MNWSTVIVADHPLDLLKTVYSHGWIQLEPYSFDGNGMLSHRERIGDQIVTWQLAQAGSSKLEVVIDKSLGAKHDAEIVNRVGRAIMADWDPRPALEAAARISPLAHKFVASGGGRFLRGSTFYEDFLKTLCTVNTTWANTIHMAKALVERVGGGAWPTPEDVLSAIDLQGTTGLGYRARVAIECSEEMVRNQKIDLDGHALVEHVPYDYLIALKGIGPYAASHMAMLQCDFARLPYDSEVAAYCRDKFAVGVKPDTFFEEWGDFRFLGYKIGRILEKSNWIGD